VSKLPSIGCESFVHLHKVSLKVKNLRELPHEEFRVNVFHELQEEVGMLVAFLVQSK